MKLILTQEVSGLGHAGDVVTVKDGFGRNFLIPRGKAIAWSIGGEKQITAIRRARKAREIRDVEHRSVALVVSSVPSPKKILRSPLRQLQVLNLIVTASRPMATSRALVAML